MELKDLLVLLYKEKFLVGGIVLLVVCGALLYQIFRPVSYNTIVSLHIARTADNSQSSKEYRYGDFYRIQADEKFADTVVRWLLSPGIVLEILKTSESDEALSYKDLSKQFSPKRLSSQFIEVRFSSRTPDRGEKIASALEKVLNARASDLNNASSLENQDGWFTVIVDDPVTYRAEPDYFLTLLISGIAGGLGGVWVVFFRAYLFRETK